MGSEKQEMDAQTQQEDLNFSPPPAHPDLLRFFCYDAVSTNKALGSSPHTDWGSPRVVWQSSKGLQVYCPLRDVWNDVPAPSSSKDGYETYVVHGGDFASLVTMSRSIHLLVIKWFVLPPKTIFARVLRLPSTRCHFATSTRRFNT